MQFKFNIGGKRGGMAYGKSHSQKTVPPHTAKMLGGRKAYYYEQRTPQRINENEKLRV